MTEDWTCGKGLAANAALPEAIGKLLDARATVLELHTRSLDLSAGSGRAEYVAYLSLVMQQRLIASALATLGHEMSGYVDLPVAGHDLAVLGAPESAAAFQALVDAERMLLHRLTATVEEHTQMLA